MNQPGFDTITIERTTDLEFRRVENIPHGPYVLHQKLILMNKRTGEHWDEWRPVPYRD